MGRGELESGIATTVLRRSLTMLADNTTQRHVLAISDPNVGSSLAPLRSHRGGASIHRSAMSSGRESNSRSIL